MELFTSILSDSSELSQNEITRLVKFIIKFDEAHDLLYEAIGLLNSGVSIETVMSDFKLKKIGWKGSNYKEFEQATRFRDSMLSKPPEVREGEIECPKCKLKKTIVVEMQTRSADEGFTYYIHCLNPKCMAKTR